VEFPPRPDTECRQATFATGEFDGCRNLTAVEFIDTRWGNARAAYPYYVKRELLDWSEVVARRKEALSAGGILDLSRHSSGVYTTTTGAYGWSPYGRILRRSRFSEGYPWCW